MSDITDHLPYLMEEALKANKILELGTRGGSSTSAFLLACLERHDGLVVSVDIDLYCGERVIERLGRQLTTYWRFEGGSSQDEYVVKHVRQYAPYDIIFIDSSHEADQTKKELEIYKDMLRTGGKFIFHDTDPRNDYWRKGVREPLNEFLAHNNRFIIERDVNFSEGLTTVVKMP